MNRWAALGAIFAGLAVGAGAFGAHALRDMVDPRMLATFETAVRYQFYHALAILVISLWGGVRFKIPVYAFTIGILLFSGSLYGLVLTEQRWFGPITPIGGLSFLVGWGILAFQLFKSAKAS